MAASKHTKEKKIKTTIKQKQIELNINIINRFNKNEYNINKINIYRIYL